MGNDSCLILYSRYPQAGNTKTRLIPHLGPVSAANLQRRMTEHMTGQMRSLSPTIDLEIHFSGGRHAQMKDWLGNDFIYQPQTFGELGTKLHRSFINQFRTGKTRVVVIGSDCPQITTAHLKQAFQQLESHDLVLGPAADGGYYLIGLSQPQPNLFLDIPWGTEHVFEQTSAIATQLNLSTALLEQLHDIDRPEDLIHLSTVTGFSDMLNDAANTFENRPRSAA